MSNMNKYKKYYYTYGILTLLYVLDYFESIEDYEECNDILKAIEYTSILTEEPNFTRLSNQAIDDYVLLFNEYSSGKKEITKEDIVNTCKIYAELIIIEILFTQSIVKLNNKLTSDKAIYDDINLNL